MEIILLHSCFGVFFVLLAYFKTKKIINPLSVIITIWISFLVLSNLSRTGLDIPSIRTQLLFLTSIASLVLGGLLALPSKSIHKDIAQKNTKSILFLVFIFAILPLTPILINSFKIIKESGYYGFLAATRWGSADVTTSIGTSGIFAFIFNITKPLIYAYFFISSALYFHSNKLKNLALSTVLMLLLAFLLSARAEALAVFFVLALGFLLNANKLNKTSKFFGLFLLLSMFGYIIFVSFTRSGGMIEIVGVFERYLVDYHTLGFTMFDKAMNDPSSIIHSISSYGTSTISAIGFTIKQIFRLFGEYYFYPAAQLRNEMDNYIAVGVDLQTGEVREANAFYTILYPIYADFGYLGFFFVPFVFGFFIIRSYLNYKRDKDVKSLTYVLFLTWTAYNCLFHPAVSSDFWWFTLFLLFLFNNIRLSILIDR